MALTEGRAAPALHEEEAGSAPAARLPLAERLHISSLDLRLAIMAAVLAAMAIAFHAVTGNFLTPENLYNVAQQSAVVGIVAAAIALVIVQRQIDLSVGSVLATVGVLVAWLIYTKGWHWAPACLAGWAVAVAIALYQGWLTAYLGVPSFVVTLGGLVTFRGAAFLISDGRTQPVTDATFLLIGGGLDGAIGITASWVLGLAVCAWLAWNTARRRQLSVQHGFAPRPLALDILYTGFLGLAVLAFVAAMCAYRIPSKEAPQGIPNPVLIWAIAVALIAFVVNRTSFGRYVYAIGGNPEAAALVGIPVKWVMLKSFVLLGTMVAVAAIVAVSRLNAGTNSLGTGMELYAIAAAVIGGIALSGGSGTVLGTVLGALIIQFLESGLLLLDVSVGHRMLIIGQVLIVAVVFDVVYRRRSGERLQ